MSYDCGNGIWKKIFAVPVSVTDFYLKMASGLSVKVLLLLLRHDGALEIPEIADMLGQSKADIRDSIHYWQEVGVLIKTDEQSQNTENQSIVTKQEQTFSEPEPKISDRIPEPPKLTYTEIPDPNSSPSLSVTESPASAPSPQKESVGKQAIKTLSNHRKKLTTQEINEMAREDPGICHLLQETQTILGKPLTPVATETVAALYSYYGMDVDLILMIIQYCSSIGKSSMRYVEKVASNWLERGIDSHEAAEMELVRLTSHNKMESKVKAAFGIHDRNLIEKEKEYIHIWTDEYAMELPLIKLAFEKAVESKGKLSFPYINGILKRWHSEGIATPAQAMQDQKENHRSRQSQDSGPSYNMEELEQMIERNKIV